MIFRSLCNKHPGFYFIERYTHVIAAVESNFKISIFAVCARCYSNDDIILQHTHTHNKRMKLFNQLFSVFRSDFFVGHQLNYVYICLTNTLSCACFGYTYTYDIHFMYRCTSMVLCFALWMRYYTYKAVSRAQIISRLPPRHPPLRNANTYRAYRYNMCQIGQIWHTIEVITQYR